MGPDNPGAPDARCALLIRMPIADAIADANTLRMYVAAHVRPSSRVAEILTLVSRYGSEAVVATLKGDDDATSAAEAAASAAMRAVPRLRER